MASAWLTAALLMPIAVCAESGSVDSFRRTCEKGLRKLKASYDETVKQEFAQYGRSVDDLNSSLRRQGDFDNWDKEQELVFGNELNADRPWRGVITYPAIYDQFVDPDAKVEEKKDDRIRVIFVPR